MEVVSCASGAGGCGDYRLGGRGWGDARQVGGVVGGGAVGGVADAGDHRPRMATDRRADGLVVEHVEVDVGAAAANDEGDVGTLV